MPTDSRRPPACRLVRRGHSISQRSYGGSIIAPDENRKGWSLVPARSGRGRLAEQVLGRRVPASRMPVEHGSKTVTRRVVRRSGNRRRVIGRRDVTILARPGELSWRPEAGGAEAPRKTARSVSVIIAVSFSCKAAVPGGHRYQDSQRFGVGVHAPGSTSCDRSDRDAILGR